MNLTINTSMNAKRNRNDFLFNLCNVQNPYRSTSLKTSNNVSAILIGKIINWQTKSDEGIRTVYGWLAKMMRDQLHTIRRGRRKYCLVLCPICLYSCPCRHCPVQTKRKKQANTKKQPEVNLLAMLFSDIAFKWQKEMMMMMQVGNRGNDKQVLVRASLLPVLRLDRWMHLFHEMGTIDRWRLGGHHASRCWSHRSTYTHIGREIVGFLLFTSA